MDQVDRFRTIIQRVLVSIADDRSSNQDVSTEILLDREHDNYMVLQLGWRGSKRIQDVIALIRIREGKILIEEDWTEEGIISFLEQAGVQEAQILLAFNPPFLTEMMEV